jgi:hypothetical protein
VAVLRDRLVACKALQDAGRYTRALEDAMQVVSEARALRHRPLIAEALNRLAQLQLDTGHPREAAATFDEAVFLAQATSHDELVTEVATAQIYVAGYLERDMARARLWMSHARAFLDRIGGHELLRAWMGRRAMPLARPGDLELVREGRLPEQRRRLQGLRRLQTRHDRLAAIAPQRRSRHIDDVLETIV